MDERVTDILSGHYGLTVEQRIVDLLERVKALETAVERLEQ